MAKFLRDPYNALQRTLKFQGDDIRLLHQKIFGLNNLVQSMMIKLDQLTNLVEAPSKAAQKKKDKDGSS